MRPTSSTFSWALRCVYVTDWLLAGDAGSGHRLPQQGKKVGELAEDQRLVAFGDGLLRELDEGAHLGADDAQLGADEPRIAGGPTQPRELREHVDAVAACLLYTMEAADDLTRVDRRSVRRSQQNNTSKQRALKDSQR